MGSKLPKFHGSPNILLTKYQLSVFYVYFLLRKQFPYWSINKKILSKKTGFEELKKK